VAKEAEVTVAGKSFKAKDWKALALGLAAAQELKAALAGKPEQAESAPEEVEVGGPVFVLRAGSKGHLRALMAAIAELPEADQGEALRTLREFELFEEK
jgi:hypothetical protein